MAGADWWRQAAHLPLCLELESSTQGGGDEDYKMYWHDPFFFFGINEVAARTADSVNPLV